MLIFDHFETMTEAARFAVAVAGLEEDRELIVTTRRLDSFKTFAAELDPELRGTIVDRVAIEHLFPFELSGVIVYVGRIEHDGEVTTEDALEAMAVAAGGRFAGT